MSWSKNVLSSVLTSVFVRADTTSEAPADFEISLIAATI
jgi:hypothetical protein